MKKIKHGMIGGGLGAFIGDAHRRASRICNDYELVAGVFDADYEKSKEFAVLEGIDLDRTYPDVDDFIKGELKQPQQERTQAVSIVTPNNLHFSAAKKLLNNGFHVICEKPMTMTVAEAEELEDLVNKTGLTFCLTHTYTGYPLIREMRKLIQEDNIIGTIQRVDAQYYQGWVNPLMHGADTHLSVWRLNPEISGISSCMGDIGVHAFNLIEYTTGLKTQRVLADLNKVVPQAKLDLDGTVLLRFDKDCLGVVRSSQMATGEENNITIAVYGSKGSLKWEQENPNYLTMLFDDKPRQIYKPGNVYLSPFAAESHTMPCGHPEGIYEAIANLYKGTAKSIRGEKLNDGEFTGVVDGVRGMKFIEAVVKSNKENNIWIDI
jgi:predicted dehydrogenase